MESLTNAVDLTTASGEEMEATKGQVTTQHVEKDPETKEINSFRGKIYSDGVLVLDLYLGKGLKNAAGEVTALITSLANYRE